MKNFIAVIWLSLFATIANAEPNRFVKKWEANCNGFFGAYKFIFESASGDSTEDDMSVKLQIGTQSPQTIAVKPALYFAGLLSTNIKSQCNNLSTANLPSGNVLVLIQRDDRPSENRVGALLLSGSDGKILDTVFDLGAQFGHAELSEVAGGVHIQLIRSWQNLSATTEPKPIAGWLGLSEVGGSIKYAWE